MNAIPKSMASLSTRKGLLATLSICTIGVLLAVAFFPAFFSTFLDYDDEGTFLVMIRSFLKRGGLYQETFTIHGPFFFLVTAPIYWLTGKQPTLDNGRLIVLTLTSISAALFAAAVWRVTKSLPWTLLCQVGTFLILITGNVAEPMHPGALVVLLLAVLSVSLASYATTHGTRGLVFAGAAVGALLMTKINIGLLAGGALILAFGVGNRALRPRVQAGLIALLISGPFLLVHENLGQSWAVALAVLVALSLLVLATISLMADEVSIPRPGLMGAALGVAGAVAVSLAFALSTGTSLGGLFKGMVTEPARIPNALTIPPQNSAFDWGAIVFMIAGAVALLMVRRLDSQPSRKSPRFSWTSALLAGAGLWLFGMGIARFSDFDTWLPLIVLLPALAIAAGAPSDVRLALRMLVPLAVLQILHVYPVAGSQVAWGTVAMAAPCAIAIATGAERLSLWADASRMLRAATATALCLIFMLGMDLWPVATWKTYLDRRSLGLAGASLLRVDATQARQLRDTTEAIHSNCDSLWFSPFGLGSFYIFTGISPPTGLFHGFPPGLLNTKQQARVIHTLSAAEARNERVCVLFNSGTPFAEPSGSGYPLSRYIEQFTELKANFGPYAIRVRPSASVE